MALTPVDLLIKELCRETGEPEFRNYDSFIGPLRRGFVQLNIAAVQVVKTAYLCLNNYNAINWPADCIKPLIVSIERCGRPITLSIDESLIRQETATVNCKTVAEVDAEIERLANIEDPEPYWNFGNGELYGLGNGFNAVGYCNHDKSSRQTIIKSTAIKQDEVFPFTYLSDGISDGLEFVPVETEPALRHYALFEYYQSRNQGMSYSNWEFFTKQVNFLRRTYQAMTAEEWQEVLTCNEKSSPK